MLRIMCDQISRPVRSNPAENPRDTPKPIRFVFDTHHHGDHAYGNEIWIENGATPLAHTGVIEERKRYEIGY